MTTNEETATTLAPDAPVEKTRKVGFLLVLGIVFVPIIFAWFTLRKGHSKLARAFAFGWLFLMTLAVFLPRDAAPIADGATGTMPSEAPAPQASPEQIAAEAEERRVSRLRRNPEEALEFGSVSGRKEGFETIFMLSGSIKNTAPFAIKDVVIECDLQGPSGTRVGRVRDTLYEIVPANGSHRFSGLNMGFMGSDQVSTYNCTIKGAQVSAG